MNQMKMKLILSLSGILLGLAMIAGASYAWFSISVKPEVRTLTIKVDPMKDQRPFDLSINYAGDEEAATWTNELILEELFAESKNYGFLRPISTADGEHWYLPTYSAAGHVNGFREVLFDKVANQVYTTDGDEDYSNYLMYVDFWVRNRQDEKYDLLLNNPDSGTTLEASEQYYGTYVLWAPKESEDGTAKTWMKDANGNLIDNDAMASTRIGFTMLEDIVDDGTPTKCEEEFYIYEPNGDMRSSKFTEYLNNAQDNGSAAKTMSHLEYIFSENTNGSIKVGDYEETYLPEDGSFYTTMVPKYKSNTEWELVDIKSELGKRVLSQKKSGWNEAALKDMEDDTRITSKALDRSKLGALGNTGTADANGVASFTANSTADRSAVTSIEGGAIKKIRMFIWLEGQDIDCWNQIADGRIFVNLEFFGRAVENKNVPATTQAAESTAFEETTAQ